jgi:hypothetical protein
MDVCMYVCIWTRALGVLKEGWNYWNSSQLNSWRSRLNYITNSFGTYYKGYKNSKENYFLNGVLCILIFQGSSSWHDKIWKPLPLTPGLLPSSSLLQDPRLEKIVISAKYGLCKYHANI